MIDESYMKQLIITNREDLGGGKVVNFVVLKFVSTFLMLFLICCFSFEIVIC